jgi:20S proteasome alpha/beta subunit
MAGFAARGVRASGAVFDLASLPKPRSTGTTIAGVVFDGGVVLGADTRATNEHMVADKECVKVSNAASC